jgi:hypothetical protein
MSGPVSKAKLKEDGSQAVQIDLFCYILYIAFFNPQIVGEAANFDTETGFDVYDAKKQLQKCHVVVCVRLALARRLHVSLLICPIIFIMKIVNTTEEKLRSSHA